METKMRNINKQEYRELKDLREAIREHEETIFVRGPLVYTVKRLRKIEFYFWAVTKISLLIWVLENVIFDGITFDSKTILIIIQIIFFGRMILGAILSKTFIYPLQHKYTVEEEYSEREEFPLTEQVFMKLQLADEEVKHDRFGRIKQIFNSVFDKLGP